ncbi:hypothetical protein OV203_33695 [Nannocystis sp. ILAH1]|uniref:hypothetical protein n=1 Tax=Nannocystis sp. ILAH1 TaxID=2996789 RepID=UPI00226E4306|nr:hypothetical protein [Nannocystis sp. ILAH1]MCY0992140.1 hypothetical protein [Nannocystis sp. ILAH1]
MPPWESPVGCAEFDACTTGSTSAGDDVTSGASEGVQTVTGEDATSNSSGTEPEDSTTGEPAAPAIVAFDLTPTPIEFNGPIAVTVTADADAVRMQLDNGDVIDLTPGEPGMFHGQIAVLTGLINGSDHVALLTPRRGDIEGETVPAPYAVALPKPGSQGFWETGNLIGEGRVVAMAALPNGQVVELGTLTINGTTHCYLRRRTKGGAWSDNDVSLLAPEDACEAIDLAVDEDGALFALVNRQGQDGLRWWLAKIAAWGQDPINVGFGTKGETASALARHVSGAVAVCGHGPTISGDDDAMVSIFRADLAGETWTFDYRPEMKLPHDFSERTRDCVFTGDTLALVGEVWGWHGEEIVERDRLSILRFDIKSKSSNWTVAPAGVKTQSGAQAVAADEAGRLIIGGYTCDDACQPEGDLRIFDGGETSWSLSLGAFPTKQFAVQDVAWSPAGYIVVATGGMKGTETAFTVRAYAPDNAEPLWTFVRKDSQVLHVALTLALGAYGEVYAGGLGANGYPAVAFIGG